MFDIGFAELLLLAGIALVVIGPDRLPVATRTVGQWVTDGKRMIVSLKRQIEKEVGLEEIQRQLHESSVLEEIEEIEGSKFSFTEIKVSDSGESEPGNWPGKPPPGA